MRSVTLGVNLKFLTIKPDNTMKLVKYIYIGCLSLMTLSSCSDYLDKESDTEATLELVFNDKDKLEGWLAGVQSGTPDPYMGYGRFIGWDVLGDEITPSERWRQWNWKIILSL